MVGGESPSVIPSSPSFTFIREKETLVAADALLLWPTRVEGLGGR